MARRRPSRTPSPATPPPQPPEWRMQIEPDYRSHRIAVDTRLVAGVWHVEIRIRRILSEATPVVFTYQWSAARVLDPERRGMLMGKTWVKRFGPDVRGRRG